MDGAVTKFAENAMNFNLIWAVATGVVAFMLLASLKAWAEKILAWWKFKNNINISIGSWLRFGTATGTADGQVISANKENIIIDMGETVRYIPTMLFKSMTWDKIKNPPDDDVLIEPAVKLVLKKEGLLKTE